MKAQYLNSVITNRLEEKLSRLNSLRPLPKPAVKKLRDHHAALQYLYELVELGKRHTISEQLIRSLHPFITFKTDNEWAGVYRNANKKIRG